MSAPLVLPPISAEIYGGVQQLVESDKAISFAGRLRFGDFGIVTRFTQFREPAPESMSTLTLDMWSVGASYRFRAGSRTTIEPEVGLAGLRFAGDGEMPLTKVGAAIGASARIDLVAHAAIVASARYLAMEELGTGIEGRAGIAVGPLQLSYRRLALDAGPALEGPEVGVGLRF